MKLAAVFAAVVAVAGVAAAAPTICWNLHDLSMAAEHHGTPARLRPYLEQALDEVMLAMFTGQHMGPVTIETPDGLVSVEEAAPVAGAVKPARRPAPSVGPEPPARNITRPCPPDGANPIDVVAAAALHHAQRTSTPLPLEPKRESSSK